MRLLILTVLAVFFSLQCAFAAPVTHPNLLLNREEIEQVKAKIAKYPWAAAALEQTKAHAQAGNAWDPFAEFCFLDQALTYVFTGDKSFADNVRGRLVGNARYSIPNLEKVDIAANPEYGAWATWGAYAWAYDLIYETCSDEERAVIERWLKLVCQIIIKGDKLHTTTPNLVFDKHYGVALVGYCLGDKELIEWGMNDPGAFGPRKGGFYQVMDSMISDGRYWNEAPAYALCYDIHGMLALAEAARHYDGTDLYNYTSKKSGASIKSIIDGYLLMGFPLERTGVGQGMVRTALFGDAGTEFAPKGTFLESFDQLTNSFFLTDLEIAYAHYKDPAYAWILSLAPDRNAPGWPGRSPWGYSALSHGEPLPEKPAPPPAPSGIYPNQGFTMLRADETPAYWTTGALAAMVRLGQNIGHGHKDFFSLVLHGKGRLLYPDVNVIQYETASLGWTREGISHSTLLVDKQSPHPGPFTTANDFTPEVKFFAVSGSAFDNVTQTRRLLLTKDYLVDVFHAADANKAPRTFDWVLHGLGRLYPGNPTAYQPSNALLPDYRWIDDERNRRTGDTWQADWIQRTGGFIEGMQFGKEWYDTEVGTRMTMLGVKDTDVFCGDGPITHAPPFGQIDGQPEPAVPLVLARRTGTAATFAALHEPYTGAPKLRHFRRLAETENAVVMMAEMPDYTDYLCVAFDDQPHTLTAADGQAFSFTEYGYLHAGKDASLLRGKLTAFRLNAKTITGDSMISGDQRLTVRREGKFVSFGSVPQQTDPVPAPQGTENAREQASALQYWLLPNEVHLSALEETDTREITLHLRSVGSGQVSGRVKITTPHGISVTPSNIDITALGEGAERTVTLTVSKNTRLKSGLYPITISPSESLHGVTSKVVVSVGVVITEDKWRPKNAQYVVRSPGYTTKVDQRSGVSFYLLDADGHRRYGRFYGNFATGFPSIDEGAQYYKACEYLKVDGNEMTVGSLPASLHYTFEEDRILYTVVEPSDPAKSWKMWLGTFETLDDPIHKSKPANAEGKGAAEWFFFPHPAFRQGVLLTLPPKTELYVPKFYGYGVSFSLKTGQDCVLQFITPAEWEALSKMPPTALPPK